MKTRFASNVYMFHETLEYQDAINLELWDVGKLGIIKSCVRCTDLGNLQDGC